MKRSAIDWLAITKAEGKQGWNDFYKAMLGRSISQPDRFYHAVDTLGHSALFEAVIIASTKTFKEDSLNYVLAVATNLVNDEVQAMSVAERYKMNLERSKERIISQNESLEERLEKAREIQNGNTS